MWTTSSASQMLKEQMIKCSIKFCYLQKTNPNTTRFISISSVGLGAGGWYQTVICSTGKFSIRKAKLCLVISCNIFVHNIPMTKNKTLRSKRAALIVDGRQVFLAENNCVSDKSRRTKPLEQTSLLKACKEPKGRQVREFHFGAGSPVHKGRVLPINHLTCKGKAVVTIRGIREQECGLSHSITHHSGRHT